MTFPIHREIERFERFISQPPRQLTIERLDEFGVLVKPQASNRFNANFPDGKDIGLVLMGLTHGNEWAGGAIINEILGHIAAGNVVLDIPVAFVLGNPWAARANKRFIERDLNRSFAKAEPKACEELRAKVLTPILKRTAYLVDYHQTSRESDRAFFIFPYAKPSFAFARAMAPRLTIVTHWGKPFSAEGMCTDEFVNSQGGVGVSLEVGQNGLDPYQIAVGVDAGLWAIRAASDLLRGTQPAERERSEPEIYTWAEIMPWPKTGVVELNAGWSNFRDVALGERLGTVGGGPLTATSAGKMLFPKYLSPEQQAALESRPTELCRLMKRITTRDLPT